LKTDARRNQQYFISKNAEWLEQEVNVHIKVIAKPTETDYEMSRTSGIRGRRKLAVEELINFNKLITNTTGARRGEGVHLSPDFWAKKQSSIN
jgi:hypothetical protein